MTSSLDEVSIPARRQQAIDRLWKMYETWKGSPEWRKTAITTSLATKVTDLTQRQEELLDRLERGDVWLWRNETAQDTRKREDQWLRWLKEFNALSDALTVVKESLAAWEVAA